MTVVWGEFLSILELSESLELVDHILPEIIAICLVQFHDMFDISWNLNTKLEADPIDAHLVSFYHQGHTFLTPQKILGSLPIVLFGQLLVQHVCDGWIWILDSQYIKLDP